jgi:hypothetical protein
VPRGNYTQIRYSGFGYGDDSLENDISQVAVDFSFATDLSKNMDNMKSGITFDLMIFTNTEDYLCYVEAVHLLQHEHIKRDCDFIHNKGIFKDSIYNLNLTDD